MSNGRNAGAAACGEEFTVGIFGVWRTSGQQADSFWE